VVAFAVWPSPPKLPQQSDGLDSQFSFLYSTSFRRDPALTPRL